MDREFLSTLDELYKHSNETAEKELSYLKDYYIQFPGEFNKPSHDLMMNAIKYSRRKERGSKKEKEDMISD